MEKVWIITDYETRNGGVVWCCRDLNKYVEDLRRINNDLAVQVWPDRGVDDFCRITLKSKDDDTVGITQYASLTEIH